MNTPHRRKLAIAAAFALVAGVLVLAPQRAAQAADTNIALGSEATASSIENAGTPASAAVDGDPTTRWSSAFSDPQWLQLDLGANADISGFTIQWEAAFATAYHIDVSNDGATWTQVYSTTSGAGGTESITAPAGTSGRYVRLTGTSRTTIGGAQYGYSIYEIQVLGQFTQTAVSMASDAASMQQGTSVDVPVRLNMASPNPVTVQYATADGSAVAGTDYTAAAGALTFAPGVTTQSIHLIASPKTVHEPTKTFSVALSNASPATVGIGPRSTTTVSILNNVSSGGGASTIDDFEGANPITDPGTAVSSGGIFAWGGDANSTPSLSIVPLDRPGVTGNHALRGTWASDDSYGGFSYDFGTAAPQDWSSFAGIEFWFYGHNPSNDAVPGSGPQYEFEIKDGGADAEHSELWQTFFTDDWQGWHLIQVPFSSLKLRTDYQPTGGPINGTLDLNEMRGFALTEPPGTSNGELDVDQFELYGVGSGITTAHISTAAAVYPVDAGHAATVGIKLTTNSDKPLDHAVTVNYSLGSGTATAGVDYTDASGAVTFPTGSASGSVQTFTVQTLPSSTPSEAKTIPVQLSATGADVTVDDPVIVINAHGLPYLNASLPVAQRVDDLLSRMTLADKIGQMTQAERGDLTHQSDITTYALGSLLSGGGSTPTPNTPQAWADMIDAFQARAQATHLQIPLLYGEDSVHGDNNLVGATVFPHNIGMGATRDPALVKEEGVIAATETRATGPTWAFSPCLCVTRDERWGRSYESYGEDPALVDQMETIIDGLQGDGNLSKNTSVLATAKHFVGDGGTAYGSSTAGSYTIDQGVTTVTQQQLDTLFLEPFKEAVEQHGVGSVMPSYSSLKIIGKDAAPIKMHARGDMITGVLKQQYHFAGFVISDWQGINQLGPDYENDIKLGVNAGIDIVMVPDQYVNFERDLNDLAANGGVTQARIDDAVRRILTQKFKLGLFEHPFTDRSNAATIGDAAHRAVARKAAAESQVLLKNDGVLPLSTAANIYVAGSNANDLGNQTGGWTVTWQGASGSHDVGTTIFQGMQADAPNAHFTYSSDASAPTAGSNVGVVVVGETPYAEGVGDIGNGHTDDLTATDRAAVDKVCAAMKCVVLVVSGRPMNIAGIQDEANAIVASWLPGTEGEGVADTLFGAAPFTGRLPESWAKLVTTTTTPVNVGDKDYDPLYPFGWGLRTDSERARIQTVHDWLATQHGGDAKHAADQLNDLLKPNQWNADGTLRDPKPAFGKLSAAAHAVSGLTAGAETNADLLVSVARDLAQAQIVAHGATAMSRTAALTADAEHALLVGDPKQAVDGLSHAWDEAQHH